MNPSNQSTWKTVRVFISSTFRDMQAERDLLVRFVFPKLREELMKYRIHFVDVDLRWGVTSDQNVLGVCREVIDECHPRFLCMLGGRYGWVPDGQDKSITADEIHYGVLGREAAKRGHAFFYFRDDNATARMVEETPGDFREPDGSANAVKLAALKKAITDAGLNPRIYGEDAQWDAAQKRLTGIEAFGNKVQEDLLQSLKNDPELAARFMTDSAAQADEFAEEAEQMEAFIEERTERFVIGSREPLLRKMTAFACAEGTPNIFVLTGDPGSGKSALLAKFTRDLPVFLSTFNSQPSTIFPHFIGASTDSTDLRRTLRRLCHELARAAGNTEPLPLDIKDLITHFQKLLAEAAGRRHVILVFDALNQFDAMDGAHWLNWLPRELPPGVRIVASVIAPADGQPEHQTLAILRTRPGTRMEKLEPLTEADTLAVIEGSLRRYAKRLSPEQLAALLAKPAGRLPLYVLTALEELRTLGTYEEITDRIRELPGDARALFGWILTERLARDPGFRDREGRPCGAALVEKFAACLGVSRHGLSPAELTALLDPGDPLGNIAALLRLLRPYLMRRGELLDFYHGQFREAAGDAYLQSDAQRQIAHVCIADFFTTRQTSPRQIEELPYQLAKAKEWQRLCDLLSKLEFLKAACEWSEFEVNQYWTEIETNSPIRILEAYRSVIQDPVQYATDAWLVAFLLGSHGHAMDGMAIQKELAKHYRETGKAADLCVALGYQAKFLLKQGDWDGAFDLLKQQEQLVQDNQLPFAWADCMTSQALVLKARGDHDRALDLFEKLEIFFRKAEGKCDKRNLPFVISEQAKIHRACGRQDKASQLVEEAELILHGQGDPNVLTEFLTKGALLKEKGNLDGAMTLFEEAEKLCRTLGDRDGLQRVLGNQGLVERTRGHFEEAMRLHQEEERLCRSLENEESLARSLANQGLIFQAQRELDAALHRFAEAERIFRKLGQRLDLALCLFNQSLTLRQKGDMDTALLLLREEASICRELGRLDRSADSFSDQAELLMRQGKADEALAALRDMEQVCRQLSNKPRTQDALRRHAMLLYRRNDLPSALAVFEEEEEICRELGDHKCLQVCLGFQADIVRRQGDLQSAIELHKEEEKICRELGDLDGARRSLGNQAGILQMMDSPEKAIEILQNVQRLTLEQGNQEGLAICLANQAMILAQKLGRSHDAFPLVQQAYRIAKENNLAQLIRKLEPLIRSFPAANVHPEVIRVKNIAAEYEYLNGLVCPRCGGPVIYKRMETEKDEDRMNDFWMLLCRACSHDYMIVLSPDSPF